jgi:hypothetical protein
VEFFPTLTFITQIQLEFAQTLHTGYKMKKLISTLLLGATFSASASAANCDLTSFTREIDQINEVFDQGTMRGEDQQIALKLIRNGKGDAALTCIQNDRLDNLGKEDLQLAIESVDRQLDMDLEYLETMKAHYKELGNYLMIEQIKDQELKSKKNAKDQIQKIQNLINSL